MKQLELTLLVWTIAKRLKKIMLPKNPWGLWATQGSSTALLREIILESPWTRHKVTSRPVTRKLFHFQGSVNPPIILRRLSLVQLLTPQKWLLMSYGQNSRLQQHLARKWQYDLASTLLLFRVNPSWLMTNTMTWILLYKLFLVWNWRVHLELNIN